MMPSDAIKFVGQLKNNGPIDMGEISEAIRLLRIDYTVRRAAMDAHGVDDDWFEVTLFIRPEEGRDEEPQEVPPPRIDRHDKRDKRFV